MNKIKLRALSLADKPLTLKWNNQDDIKDLYAGHPFPVNMENESSWYEKILKSNIPISVFGIELAEEKKLIGLVILKDINLIHRKAEFAIFIGDKTERGKAYSKKASNLMIKFGFYDLGLHRIYLHVLTHNEGAIKLYKRLGFSIEGELIDTVFKKGEFHNEFIMSIFSKDFSI
jgi:diamine N-acetyltransferase